MRIHSISCLFALLLLAFAPQAWAQVDSTTTALVDTGQRPVRLLTLEEAIVLAREYSHDALLARKRFEAAYWQHRSYKAEFLPAVRLSGELPNFSKSLTRYQLPDGSFSYIPEFANNMGLELNVEQSIPWTGTKVYAKTSLDRTDIFGENRLTKYMAVPVQVGLRQSIFGVNELRWKSKIEPLAYEEARRTLIQDQEAIAQTASNLFFQLLLAQESLAIAKLNHANADTLFKIAKGRYNIGTIAEDDLLQMELNYLTAGQEVNDAGVTLEMQRFRLVNYLGLTSDYQWELVVPTQFPQATMSYQEALDQAAQNNPSMVGYERRVKEAEKGVATARASRGFSADIVASWGLTQQAPLIPDAYRNPMDQLSARLAIQIPILDWGRGKGLVRVARSNLQVVQTQVDLERVEFEQNLFLQVMRYAQQPDQIALAAKADTIGQNRYRIAKERFLIGKINVIDLDKAQTDRDSAKNRYLRAMQTYWQVYFELRRLTLFDPTIGQPLKVDFEALLLK